MKLALASVLMAPLLAHSAVVGVAKTGEGQIELHDVAGQCVGTALRATYRPANPATAPIAGCWVAGGGVVFVVFMDADVARIPMTAVTKPESV